MKGYIEGCGLLNKNRQYKKKKRLSGEESLSFEMLSLRSLLDLQREILASP